MALGASLLLAAVVADGVSVTETVHGLVTEAAAGWSRSARIAVVTVEALEDGRIVRVDESWSQPVGSLALLTQAIVHAAGATADGAEPILCASRIVVGNEGGAPAVATACLTDGSTTEMIGWEDAAREGSDASRDLFAGLGADADAAALRALAAYRRAAERAPTWSLPALMLGLALVRAGRLEEGRPHLERWAKGGGLVSAEVRGYIGGEATARRAPSPMVAVRDAGSTVAVAMVVAQCERDAIEISEYVRSRWPQLIACVRDERAAMPPRLPVSFVVRPSGEVAEAQVEHRHFKKGKLGTCVRGALGEPLAPHAGGDCPSRFDIEVKSLSYTSDR